MREFTKLQVVFWMLGLILLECSAASQEKPYAPLPDKITAAKTVFIVNDSGAAKLGDELYRQLKTWNRWQVVTDKEKADLILVINQQESVAGYVSSASATATGSSVSGTGVSVPVKSQKWFLHVVDGKTGDKLWTADASMGGKLWRSWGAIAKSLISDIKKRMQ
jgi:hypothetical protein